MKGSEHAEAGDLAGGEVIKASEAGKAATEQGPMEQGGGAGGDIRTMIGQRVPSDNALVLFLKLPPEAQWLTIHGCHWLDT